jgi:tetratricopeptide (TPR) repeat protein
LIDWSYNLLPPSEQTCWQKLSVFAGGWTVSSAMAVCCGGEFLVLDCLNQLVNKSLVVLEQSAGEARYHFLETIRQYGFERLTDTAAVRDRHLAYYLNFANGYRQALVGAGQSKAVKAIAQEYANLREAIEWSTSDLSNLPRLEQGLLLATAMGQYWIVSGTFNEGRFLTNRLITAARSAGMVNNLAYADVCHISGDIAVHQGDDITAIPLLEESWLVFRNLDYKPGIAYVLNNLAIAFGRTGELQKAKMFVQEAFAVYTILNDKRGMAYSLHIMGNFAFYQNDFASAYCYYYESLTLKNENKDIKEIAIVLVNLGNTAYMLENWAEAKAFTLEGIALAREINSKYSMSIGIGNLGNIAYQEGDYQFALDCYFEALNIDRENGQNAEFPVLVACIANILAVWWQKVRPADIEYLKRSARLCGVVQGLLSEHIGKLSSPEYDFYQQALAICKANLSEGVYQASFAYGAALLLPEALEYALASRLF